MAFNDTFQDLLKGFQGNVPSGQVNLSEPERLISTVSGSLMAFYGLRRGSFFGLIMLALGGDLLYRGLTGHSFVYDSLGINGARKGLNPNAAVQASKAIKVNRSVTINKSPEELYRYWRNFENLPRFMDHLEAVKVLDDKHSTWKAKAPAGTMVEWQAEIYNEKENELIAWRSMDGSSVANAGSVLFKPAPGDRGTEVRVELDYEPPAGALGAIVAKLFGEEPTQQVQEDLRHFKQIMEAGETPTTKDQPSSRAAS
jgi:uncharacterized membrane protein